MGTPAQLVRALWRRLSGFAPGFVRDRYETAQLAEVQASLRRVATLVARGAPPEEVFEVVAVEVGRLGDADAAGLMRYESDGTYTLIGVWSEVDGVRPAVGTREPVRPGTLTGRVFETCKPVRLDKSAPAAAGEYVADDAPWHSAVGAPLLVEGRLWGIVGASRSDGPLPDHAEARVTDFADLLASAIANTESREQLNRLAEQQAALRRVATLVAEREAPERVFAVVASEVARVVDVPMVSIARYESDGTASEQASFVDGNQLFPVGTRWSLDGTNVLAQVRESGRPARIDDYSDLHGTIVEAVRRAGIRSTVGIPIVVAGRMWGAMVASSAAVEPLPDDTEARLTEFTDLVATAIANAEFRAGLARLAEEQAALRRVATLVARAAPADELFAAVADEVAQLFPVELASMARYDADSAMTIVAVSGREDWPFSVGTTLSLGGRNLSTVIAETHRPARIDSYAESSGAIGARFRDAGVGSAVGTPIMVDGRLWGLMAVSSSAEQALPPGIEARLTSFTDLLATAIANAESRGELAASRARIVTAADATRRGIERDLHDGVQQQLVSLGLELRSVQRQVPPDLPTIGNALSRLADGLGDVQGDLVEIARGLHPAILARGGLGPALKALARRSSIPVEIDLRLDDRLPERVEVPAYYVVSEALTNAAKHASASFVQVAVEARERKLRVFVNDDGVGGADPARGSGLVGLRDRVEAFGGTLNIQSPVGAGTTLQVELPLDD